MSSRFFFGSSRFDNEIVRTIDNASCKESLSGCIKGIRVDLIWSLLIIVQEISSDRRLSSFYGGRNRA